MKLLLMRLHYQDHQWQAMHPFLVLFFILDKDLVQTNELVGPSTQAPRGNTDIQ